MNKQITNTTKEKKSKGDITSKPLKKKIVKKVKKKKLRTLKSLKKELWYWTSLAVKLKGADENGFCTCITTGKKMFYYKDQANAGHFLSFKKTKYLRYSIHNIFPESAGSNIIGNQYIMSLGIQDLYDKGLTKYSPLQLLEIHRSNKPYKEDRKTLNELIITNKGIALKYAEMKSLWHWKESCLKMYLKEN